MGGGSAFGGGQITGPHALGNVRNVPCAIGGWGERKMMLVRL